MPKPPRLTNAQRANLKRLPRRLNLVLEGGIRPLSIQVPGETHGVHPLVAMWVDGQTGAVRGNVLISPESTPDGGVTEALRALVAACIDPIHRPGHPGESVGGPPADGAEGSDSPRLEPGLPVRIVVDDAGLAQAIRGYLEGIEVKVEIADQLPAFDGAVASLDEYMRAESEEVPFAWEIDAALVPPLYKAAAAYWKRKAWDYMADYPPVAIQLGEHGPEAGVKTLYASIMGAADLVNGVVFYYTPEAMERVANAEPDVEVTDAEIDDALSMLMRFGAPTAGIPRNVLREAIGSAIEQEQAGASLDWVVHENGLVVFFSPDEETSDSYREWLKAHGVKGPTRRTTPSFHRTSASDPRPPDARETRALTLALEGLAQFFGQHGRTLREDYFVEEAVSTRALVGEGETRALVEVSFPAEGFDFADDEDDDDLDNATDEIWGMNGQGELTEEPPPPASIAGASTLYRFQVAVEPARDVWRRIEMRGDQTLDDLHNAIQEAFEWDDDHLYAFYLSGKAWDEDTEYQRPFTEGRSAGRARLEHLALHARQRFLYIFDFGDEWRHTIKLEAIAPGGVEAGQRYPRVTERHGDAIAQYGPLDGFSDEPGDVTDLDGEGGEEPEETP
jgi:hypothetical protein